MKYTIINSDIHSGLYSLDDNSVNVAITSPPYWGQRDYGFDGQIGNESTYSEYIEKLVINFKILRNKLNEKGVFFLNIGDKYISQYGKTPLGFIPFKLAKAMEDDGWILIDTIIWFKPNHMPSSVKNRFTNSYEPVFVFAKSVINFFTQQIEITNDKTNIIKIPLQPTPYKHVAVYPERLVLELLRKIYLPENSTILDPFAGSGTTLKVVIDNFKKSNAIMIEFNKEYVEIIKKRCNLGNKVDIKTYQFMPYYTQTIINQFVDNELFEEEAIYIEKKKSNGFVRVFENKDDYYFLINQFKNKRIKNSYKNNCTFFIGSKEFDNELIYNTSLLDKKGWIIRNMLIIEDNNRWFPIFMIVDDNKLTKYVFNFKSLNLKSKNEYKRNWHESNYIGYKVLNSVNKNKTQGKVVEIVERLTNGFPKYVVVEWEDNTFSKEFVVFSQEEIIGNGIIHINEGEFSFKEILNFTELNNQLSNFKKTFITPNYTHNGNNYNGKFKNEKRINFGASPGARSSVDEEYFSLQRLYNVDQAIVSDYLNHKRIQKGYTKQELTKLFPQNYRHTVGHWLRKDFGGSLPIPDDWYLLTEFLDIEDDITNYVCKTALRIQTVKHAEFKVPNDFQQIEFIESLKILIDSQ